VVVTGTAVLTSVVPMQEPAPFSQVIQCTSSKQVSKTQLSQIPQHQDTLDRYPLHLHILLNCLHSFFRYTNIQSLQSFTLTCVPLGYSSFRNNSVRYLCICPLRSYTPASGLFSQAPHHLRTILRYPII